MKMKKIAYLFLLTALLSCAEPVDKKLRIELEKEFLDWSFQATKSELAILKKQGIAEDNYYRSKDSLITLLGDSAYAQRRQTYKNLAEAIEIVSGQNEKFLDETSAWLKKLDAEGMSREEAKSQWEIRRSQFGEIKKEFDGLLNLYEKVDAP
jgi:hypothetical protein